MRNVDKDPLTKDPGGVRGANQLDYVREHFEAEVEEGLMLKLDEEAFWRKDGGEAAVSAIIFFHSIAANGNIGLSGQAQWLPVAVTTRNHAPKSPTIPRGHTTTRVKRVSAPKGPAHLYSCQHFEYTGRRQHKYCDAANYPY